MKRLRGNEGILDGAEAAPQRLLAGGRFPPEIRAKNLRQGQKASQFVSSIKVLPFPEVQLNFFLIR